MKKIRRQRVEMPAEMRYNAWKLWRVKLSVLVMSEQIEDVPSFSFSSLFNSPFSDNMRMALETSLAIGDPFWKACMKNIVRKQKIKNKKIVGFEKRNGVG